MARWRQFTCAMALAVCGCGGGVDLGFRGTIPAQARYVVDAAIAPGTSLRFPDVRPFNVHDKLSAQTPGPDGEARGEASADAGGRALCRASVENGGEAWGRFQLGHCLDNRTDQPLVTDVEMTIDYETVVECLSSNESNRLGDSEADAPQAEASVTLRALIKDSNEVVLRSVDLAVLTNDAGRLSKPGRETLRLRVTMQPGLAYTLVVLGQSEANADTNTSGTAEIVVKSLGITVTGRT